MPNPIDLTRLEALHAEATRFYASGRIELTHDDETARRWAVVAFEAFPDLLSELKELREKVQMTVDYNTALRAERDRLRAERDAANATIAGLRLDIKRTRNRDGLKHDEDAAGVCYDWCMVCRFDAALARTPDQHRARIEAAGLREAAKVIRQTTPDGEMKTEYYSGMKEGHLYAATQIEEMAAERLERGE